MPAQLGKYGVFDALTPSGREKTRASKAQEELANLTGDIARDIFQSTGGLRATALSNLNTFLENGTLPTALMPPTADLYRTGREDLESQFNVARERVLNQVPGQGGELNTALRDLEAFRAGQVGRLRTDIRAQVEQAIRNQLFSAAIGTAFGSPPQSIAGLNIAGTQYGNIANRALGEQLHREDAAKAEMQEIGQLIGMAAGT